MTAEILRGEAWLFASGAGDYAASDGRGQRLVERVTQMSLRENNAWANAMRQAVTAMSSKPGASKP